MTEVLTVMNSKKIIYVRAADSKGRWSKGGGRMAKHELQIVRAVGADRVNVTTRSLQTTQKRT